MCWLPALAPCCSGGYPGLIWFCCPCFTMEFHVTVCMHHGSDSGPLLLLWFLVLVTTLQQHKYSGQWLQHSRPTPKLMLVLFKFSTSMLLEGKKKKKRASETKYHHSKKSKPTPKLHSAAGAFVCFFLALRACFLSRLLGFGFMQLGFGFVSLAGCFFGSFYTKLHFHADQDYCYTSRNRWRELW